jgi:hypothetical protein
MGAHRVGSGWHFAEGVLEAGGRGGKAYQPSVSQADPRRLRLEIQGGRKVRRDATDTL